MIVTAISTQGRYGYGRGQEYMEEYTVEYWRPIFGSKWRNYTFSHGKQVWVYFNMRMFRAMVFQVTSAVLIWH